MERLPGVSQDDLKFYRMLVDAVTDYGIFTLDPRGIVTSWNPGAERDRGYRADEIIGEHLSIFYTSEDVEQKQPEHDLEMAAAKGQFETEGWRVRKDGAQFWAHIVFTAIRDEAGRLIAFSNISRDLTMRKQAEERRKAISERLAARAAELARVNNELAQKNAENEMFIYSVSHDLRSPLVNLEGFSKELQMIGQDLRNLLLEPDVPASVQKRGLVLLDEEMATALHFIQSGVLRLSNIIDALLRLSRAGRVEYQWQSVDLNRIVSRIVDSLRDTIAERRATVTVHELPSAWGDPTALDQVFANLIDNALKYLDPARPGHIEVGYERQSEDDDFQTYWVKDNGVGIPAQFQPRIFQIFQRLHSNSVPGEGLGLALVRRIVERHGGTIWVESAEGEGSTFFVKLPRRAVL